MKLHDLRPSPGSKKSRKRKGRGIAAGQGKTAGRGTKGQNARSGGGKGPFFEGGQLPLVRRLPIKRGFYNRFKVYYRSVNVERLSFFAEGTEVDPAVLSEASLIKKASLPVAVLGNGELDRALTVKAHRFSKSARAKIEAAGGTAVELPWIVERPRRGG
ncbi:MAG: 50S ribosomal protein L15 [Chloroflexota bacterium]